MLAEMQLTVVALLRAQDAASTVKPSQFEVATIG